MFSGILGALWWRQRKTNQAIEELGKISAELGQLLGERWREGTEREERLVELQASIEKMTQRLKSAAQTTLARSLSSSMGIR
jgi:hypothetical protein